MRLGGKKIQDRYLRLVRLPRPDGSFWEFAVSPLRLGFHQTLQQRGIVAPSAPTKVARDSSGKPLRDADGLAVIQRDENDSQYLEAVEDYHRRVAMIVLWEGLKSDERIEFETSVPKEQVGWDLFADQLHAELEQSGWTAGDLIWICERIAEMSNMTGEHFRESQQNFFSAAGTDST